MKTIFQQKKNWNFDQNQWVGPLKGGRDLGPSYDELHEHSLLEALVFQVGNGVSPILHSVQKVSETFCLIPVDFFSV